MKSLANGVRQVGDRRILPFVPVKELHFKVWRDFIWSIDSGVKHAQSQQGNEEDGDGGDGYKAKPVPFRFGCRGGRRVGHFRHSYISLNSRSIRATYGS